MEKSARVRDVGLYDRSYQEEYDRLYKIIVVGDSGTGKSQIVSRFSKNKFCDDVQPTIIMEHTRKILKHKRICAHLWDMAGRDMFRSITSCYYKHAVAAVVVYDITKVRSFENATQWLEHLHQTLGSERPVTMLVGNKLDLRHQRSVTSEDGLRLARKHKVLFMEVSACDATNVQTAFNRLIDHVTEKVIEAELERDVKRGAGLQAGAKSLNRPEKESGSRGVITVVQQQPKSKFSIRVMAHRCLEGTKESCSKLPCCFD